VLDGKQIYDSRKKFAKTLCKLCFRHEEFKEREAKETQFTQTVTSPDFVKKSIEAVQAKKSGNAQPVVRIMDKGTEELA
jgi:hypothetical protein